MQRVRVVQWSLDNKYIISGSDEMNIRVWKARASEKLGMVKINDKMNAALINIITVELGWKIWFLQWCHLFYTKNGCLSVNVYIWSI